MLIPIYPILSHRATFKQLIYHVRRQNNPTASHTLALFLPSVQQAHMSKLSGLYGHILYITALRAVTMVILLHSKALARSTEAWSKRCENTLHYRLHLINLVWLANQS